MGNTMWRAAPISVEKLLDELRVGVKGQSNLEIARTPRNAFRCSLGGFGHEVERLIRCEGFTAYQVLINSECVSVNSGSEGRGAKVPSLKEKNPDHRLRSPNKR